MSHFQYLTEEQIHNSPSHADGMTDQEIDSYRHSGCIIIRKICSLASLYPFPVYVMDDVFLTMNEVLCCIFGMCVLPSILFSPVLQNS